MAISKSSLSISGQHYLFTAQTLAHLILARGGDNYHYVFRSQKTEEIFDDVQSEASELGVIMLTSQTEEVIKKDLDSRGLTFTKLAESKPQVALPKSHPLVNASELSLDELEDWPYVYFEQNPDNSWHYFEEALSDYPRTKTLATTDRASLTELIVALNGYTITSGILVGISDGGSLHTLPLKTDVLIQLGIVTKKDAELGELGEDFVRRLKKILDRYARI